MTSTVKVNWRLPADEWEAFRDYVYDKHGEIKGKLGDEVERAMIEYIERDSWVEVERKVDRLISAAGRSPDSHTKIKSVSNSSGETVCARARVPEEVKEDFRAFVKETDQRAGKIFTLALRERRNGGRSSRVADKLDRVLEDAERLLAEANPESDGDGIGPVERRTIAIIDRLRSNGEIGQILDQDLEEAIRQQGLESEKTINKYRSRIIERLDYVTHQSNSELWVPADSEFAPGQDSPALDRKPYSNLSRKEKFRGLQIHLARRASGRDRAQVGVEGARQEIFGGHPSESHVRELMAEAGSSPGFEWTTINDQRRLRVDLNGVENDVLEAIDSSVENVNQDDERAADTELDRLMDADRPGRGDV